MTILFFYLFFPFKINSCFTSNNWSPQTVWMMFTLKYEKLVLSRIVLLPSWKASSRLKSISCVLHFLARVTWRKKFHKSVVWLFGILPCKACLLKQASNVIERIQISILCLWQDFFYKITKINWSTKIQLTLFDVQIVHLQIIIHWSLLHSTNWNILALARFLLHADCKMQN